MGAALLRKDAEGQSQEQRLKKSIDAVQLLPHVTCKSYCKPYTHRLKKLKQLYFAFHLHFKDIELIYSFNSECFVAISFAHSWNKVRCVMIRLITLRESLSCLTPDFYGFFLSARTDSRVWANCNLHHQFSSGQDYIRAMRAGPKDLSEPQGEVHREEHRFRQ